jgi:hypothetical protein
VFQIGNQVIGGFGAAGEAEEAIGDAERVVLVSAARRSR